jgi:hypothetical protein
MFKISPKTIVLGGLAIAAAAGALKNRDKVAGLIGARSSAPEPPRPEPSTPAGGRAVSNYDVSGPVENTATKVPAPEALVRDEDGGIDERAEEEAAAAEAAAIGGSAPEYPGLSLDEEADEAERPLMEAGEGESEGEEIAEFDLEDEAESRAGDRSDAEVQVEDAIEAQENPTTGESIEAMETSEPDAGSEDSRPEAATAKDAVAESPATNGSGVKQATFGFAGGKVGAEEPEEGTGSGLPSVEAVEAVKEEAEAEEDAGPEIHPDQTSLLEEEEESDAPKETPAAEKSSAVWEPPKSPGSSSDDDDEGGSEWQTWSGRAIRP